MKAVVSILTVPFIILNFLGGIVAGIWLAILGEWWAIGFGLASLLFSSFILALILMPSIIFAGPAAALFERGKIFLGFPLLVLSQIYTYGVITAWCLFVLFFFLDRAHQDTFWPLLIWSYGVALGPWMYMANKESQGGTGSAASMTTFFAQVAYVVTAIVGVSSNTSFLDLVYVFSGVMLVAMLIQTGFTIAIALEERRSGIF